MVGCQHSPLYLLGSGGASQETAVTGSCQQALLASAVVSGLVTVYGMDPQVAQSLDGFSFNLCFTLCPCISFRQEPFWVKNLEMSGYPIFQLGPLPNLWIWSLQTLSPLLGISANLIPVGPGSLLLSCI